MRTFELIVSEHPYCAHKFTCHVMHRARPIRQMALPGFNDLGRLVKPIFLLMDHFLYRFSTFSEKIKKNY